MGILASDRVGKPGHLDHVVLRRPSSHPPVPPGRAQSTPKEVAGSPGEKRRRASARGAQISPHAPLAFWACLHTSIECVRLAGRLDILLWPSAITFARHVIAGQIRGGRCTLSRCPAPLPADEAPAAWRTASRPGAGREPSTHRAPPILPPLSSFPPPT